MHEFLYQNLKKLTIALLGLTAALVGASCSKVEKFVRIETQDGDIFLLETAVVSTDWVEIKPHAKSDTVQKIPREQIKKLSILTEESYKNQKKAREDRIIEQNEIRESIKIVLRLDIPWEERVERLKVLYEILAMHANSPREERKYKTFAETGRFPD